MPSGVIVISDVLATSVSILASVEGATCKVCGHRQLVSEAGGKGSALCFLPTMPWASCSPLSGSVSLPLQALCCLNRRIVVGSAGSMLKTTWPRIKKRSVTVISPCLNRKPFGFLRNKAFLGKNKISIDSIHERFSLMKQCSALLNFYFLCCLVGKNSLRSLRHLHVHGGTLLLDPEGDLFLQPPWLAGFCPHCGNVRSAHCLSFWSGVLVQKGGEKWGGGEQGSGDQERFLFCFKTGKISM